MTVHPFLLQQYKNISLKQIAPPSAYVNEPTINIGEAAALDRNAHKWLLQIFFLENSVVIRCRSVCLQVIRRRAVGDHYISGAAVPGSVQRTGSEIRHGGSVPGPARKLPGEDVSKNSAH